MYSSRGRSNAYGQQQPYSSQSSYPSHNLGGSSTLPKEESELSGHMNHLYGRVPGHHSVASASQSAHYSGLYGSQQMSPMRSKGPLTVSLEGQSSYMSSIPDSPKFVPKEYIPSSTRDYGQKVDQLYPDMISEYPSVERRQYTDRQSAYIGKDLASETTNRFTDSVTYGRQHQSTLYDHTELTPLIRQEPLLKAHTLPPASAEGGARQADYLASRASARVPSQGTAYGARFDPEPRSLPIASGSSYGGQLTASILGSAPQRSIDHQLYGQSSLNPGYGVSLPPGRDYGAGKGLRGALHEPHYPSAMLGRASQNLKDDLGAYAKEQDRRERENDYLRIREREREREKDHLREREHERERERERERQREREREWQRERQWEKERERERDRREKEIERELKRGHELKRDLTPARASRDRRGSSLANDVRPLRRDSPRREVVHRPRSPVKEKRRDYSCKVISFNLLESERDYLSLDKRYSRLYISPECSKVSIFWPKGNLKLSLYNPVSFEHDFVEDSAVERKDLPPTQLTTDKLVTGGQTVWNAKIIFMSGLSQNSLAELCSDRIYDDRIPHFCNLLRFAILKNNNSFTAIGGPWESVDGGDPSVDESALVRAAMRYVKDVTNLDVKDCKHWNRFLEIHYDRVGKDGHFSHKEVTVLFVPDLSESLPSVDLWRNQWLTHRKAISERELQSNLKKQITGDKEEVPKDEKKPERTKDSCTKVESPEEKEQSSSGRSINYNSKEEIAQEEAKDKGKTVEIKEAESIKEQSEVSIAHVEVPSTETANTVQSGKKKTKIVKRIVKRKVPKKKEGAESSAKQNDEVETDNVEEKNITLESSEKQEGVFCDAAPIKTFVRKKIVKKTVDSAAGENEVATPEAKTGQELQSSKGKPNDESKEGDAVKQGSAKTTVKKKIVKLAKIKAEPDDNNTKVAEGALKEKSKNNQPEVLKIGRSEEAVLKPTNVSVSKDTKSDKKENKKSISNEILGSAMESGGVKNEVSQNDRDSKSSGKAEPKDKKERKDHVENESKNTANKVTKGKERINEPPKHPGLILQTRGSKVSKVQSLSLSLDSLLDYSDKDIEESTFELSLFAESLYEMLQYEMGSRLLAFLQKLRIKFVRKRNQKKREREETSRKKVEESSPIKRTKTDEADAKVDTVGNTDDTHQNEDTVTQKNNDQIINDEVNGNEQVDKAEIEKPVEEDEEDPEEDPEEDEEMVEANLNQGPNKEEHMDEEKASGEALNVDDAPNLNKEQQETTTQSSKIVTKVEPSSGDVLIKEKPKTEEHHDDAKQTSETITKAEPSSGDNKLSKEELKTKVAPAIVDKELLQAFRFFDRNCAGYIRVEDLRLIIHSLGKFLPNRDVKELVQSALLESNTGRDDKILYDKLVKMQV